MVETLVRDRGVVTLPQQVREELGLEAGDHLLVTIEDGRVVLIPAALVPRDQMWFWSSEWQEGEREADSELAAGVGQVFLNEKSFLDSLQ